MKTFIVVWNSDYGDITVFGTVDAYKRAAEARKKVSTYSEYTPWDDTIYQVIEGQIYNEGVEIDLRPWKESL